MLSVWQPRWWCVNCTCSATGVQLHLVTVNEEQWGECWATSYLSLASILIPQMQYNRHMRHCIYLNWSDDTTIDIPLPGSTCACMFYVKWWCRHTCNASSSQCTNPQDHSLSHFTSSNLFTRLWYHCQSRDMRDYVDKQVYKRYNYTTMIQMSDWVIGWSWSRLSTKINLDSLSASGNPHWSLDPILIPVADGDLHWY